MKRIELLKKAAQIGRDGFKDLAKFIRKNGFRESENFLHFKAIEKMSHIGKYDLSFDPIVAINKNAAKPHALPTNTKLKLHDLLLVDAGVKYKRYCSDRTCTSHVDFENFLLKENKTSKVKNIKKFMI